MSSHDSILRLLLAGLLAALTLLALTNAPRGSLQPAFPAAQGPAPLADEAEPPAFRGFP